MLAILAVALFSTPAHAACSSPTGSAGDMIYSSDWRVPQYCNGTIWVQGGVQQYNPVAVTFDGTNDYLTRGAGLSGAADSKFGWGSFWIRRNGGNGTKQVIYSNTGPRFEISLDTSNKIRLEGGSTTANNRLVGVSGTAITDTNWHSVVFGFDVNVASCTSSYIYIDGVDSSPTWSTCSGAANIDFTVANHSIGALVGGGSKLNADLADIHLDIGAWANPPGVISEIIANGKPVPLSTYDNCSGHELCFSGPLASWHTNDGTGGGFTLNGALTASGAPIVEAGYSGMAGTISTSGLTGWWKLDESGNVSTAADSTGSNTGTLTNFPADPTANWVAGQFNNALDFDGSNDYLSIANESNFDIDNGNPYTFAAWIKRDTNTTQDQIVDKTSGTTGFQLYLTGGAGNIQHSMGNGTIWANTTATGSPVPTGTWTHIAVTKSTSATSYNDIKIYVNGVDVTNNNNGQDASSGSMLNNVNMVIGADAGGGNPFDGKIDDARFYSRELSPSEIAQIYQNGGGCANPSGAQGDVIYNAGTRHVLQYCEGRNWKPMGPVPGSGGGGCANPAGAEGDIRYNAGTNNVMQYCDGTKWVPVGGTSPVAPSSGLVAYWKLDESAGTGADSTGNGYTLTLSGNAAWQSTGGKAGGALQLDGTGDYADTANPFGGLTATSGVSFTFAMWIKTSQSTQDDFLGWSPYRSCSLGTPSAGLIGCTVNSDVYVDGLFTSTRIDDNNWHHVAWTVNNGGATEKIYIDGRLENTVTGQSIATLTPTAEITIGARPFGGETQGYFDDVRVYDRDLSSGEVYQLYHATGGQ